MVDDTNPALPITIGNIPYSSHSLGSFKGTAKELDHQLHEAEVKHNLPPMLEILGIVVWDCGLGCHHKSPTQRAQHPLVKEDTLNHNLKAPVI